MPSWAAFFLQQIIVLVYNDNTGTQIKVYGTDGRWYLWTATGWSPTTQPIG